MISLFSRPYRWPAAGALAGALALASSLAIAGAAGDGDFGMTGRVVDAEGRAIVPAVVSLANQRISARAQTAYNGMFQFYGLKAGTGVIDVTAPGYARLECPIDLYRGGDVLAQITLSREADVAPACARSVIMHPE